LADDSDEGEEASRLLERRASAREETRERRLSARAEVLHAAAAAVPAPVASPAQGPIEVVSEAKEWGQLQDDSDEGEEASRLLQRRASARDEMREQRLSVGAEALHLAAAAATAAAPAAPPAHGPVEVVSEAKEWAQLEEDSDEGEVSSVLQRRASARDETRERRLSVGAEVLHRAGATVAPQPPARVLPVMTESKEWGGAEDDSDEEEEASRVLERRASALVETRERRLSAGAAALHLAGVVAPPAPSGDGVPVVVEAKEWGEMAEDSDEGEEASRVLERRASAQEEMRERRLSIGAEALHLAGAVDGAAALSAPAGGVAVVAEAKEWGQVADEDSDEGEEAPLVLQRRASAREEIRERRLSARAEVLHLAGAAVPPAPTGGVPVMAEAKEWGQAVEEDSDEGEEAPLVLQRRASAREETRERRLTAGAEALHMARAAAALPLAPPAPAGGVTVVAESREWGQAADDSDEGEEAKRLLSRASARQATRERRLTAGAEALHQAAHAAGRFEVVCPPAQGQMEVVTLA